MTVGDGPRRHRLRWGPAALTVAALVALLAVAVIVRPGADPVPLGADGSAGGDQPSVTPPARAYPGPESTGTTIEPRSARPGGTLDRPGAVTEDVVLEGDVELRGDRQVLRNVRVEGRVLVTGHDITVEDSEIGSLSISGAQRFTGRRLEIFGFLGSDGVHITSDRGRVQDVLIEDSWIHSPQLAEGSHYDGVQVRGVDRLTLRGNRIDLGEHDPRMTAAVFLQEANGGNTEVLIADNWLGGGGYTLYLGGDGVTVTGNVFGTNAAYGLLYPDTRPTRFTASGNRWEDGDPVDLQ